MNTPPLSLTKGAKYVFKGKEVEVDSVDVDTGNVLLKRPFTGEMLSYSLSAFTTLRMNGQLPRPGEKLPRHQPTGRANGLRLKDDQRERAARRLAYATACTPLYPIGPLSHRLATAIAEVAARIRDRSPPSPHSVYRWVRRYVLSNYDTAVFVQDAGAIRKREPRIDRKVKELLEKEIERLLGADKDATLNGILDEAMASVAKQLGYLKFTAKDGVDYLPDEFLINAQQKRAQAKVEGPAHGN